MFHYCCSARLVEHDEKGVDAPDAGQRADRGFKSQPPQDRAACDLGSDGGLFWARGSVKGKVNAYKSPAPFFTECQLFRIIKIMNMLRVI